MNIVFILTFVAGSLFLQSCSSHQKRSVGALNNPIDETLNDTYLNFKKGPSLDTEGTLSLPTLFSRFLLAKYNLEEGEIEAGEIKSYVDAGIALSNKSCSAYFAAHNSEYERINYEQGVINILGNVLTAGLSFSDSNVNAMGYTALLLGGVNSSYELFKEDHFLTGTIWKLEKGVREGRLESAKNLKENTKGENAYNYYEAHDALLQYHNTCSRLQLIAYVESSIDLARYTPVSYESTIDSSKVINLSIDLYKIVHADEGVFSRKRLEELYVLFFAVETSWGQKLATYDHLSEIQAKIKDWAESSTDVDRKKRVTFLDKLEKVGELLKMNEAIASREKDIFDKKEKLEEAKEAREKEAKEAEKIAAEAEEKEAKEALSIIKSAPIRSMTNQYLPIMLDTVPKK